MRFEKNLLLEDRLQELLKLLKPVEDQIIANHQPDYSIPVVFLIGSPRSGSTLFIQWAASLGVFATPTNFLSRLYYAPYIGALISEMLTNPAYDYRNEFEDIIKAPDYSSVTGKTVGFNAPHEFWYFWRLHFYLPEVPIEEKQFLKTADFVSFNKELRLMQRVFRRPLVMKAHICTPYLESFAGHMENTVFVHLHRDPIANIKSLLKARLTWNHSVNQWFSAKPREYAMLKEMDPYHQVAGQVYFKEKQILDKRHILGERYISLTYEAFCENPDLAYQQIINLTNRHIESANQRIMASYSGQDSFAASQGDEMFDENKIKKAYNYFENEFGKLVY